VYALHADIMSRHPANPHRRYREPVHRRGRPVSTLRLAALLALGAALSVVAGCSGDDDAGDASDTTAVVAKPPIEIVVSNWTASALNAAIADQLIERHLGYPVDRIRIDNSTEIYDGLADGSLDAVLEIWPSDMTDRDRLYFERGEVVDLGPLGPVGKIGWFVPRYVLEQYPELSSWESLQNAELAGVFATGETQPKGRLLGTNPDYVQYDEAIIQNLGLPLALVYSGSEEATLAELAARHGAAEPILLYWWTPTAAVAEYDLVNVPLPPPTDACLDEAAAGGSGVDCDYPDDQLFKAAAPSLATEAPEVDAFLRAFTLTGDQQAAMLAAVEFDGRSIEDVAGEWVEANEPTWRTWLEGA
jgi:glycine betaine/proline transport system substrate-binding protein